MVRRIVDLYDGRFITVSVLYMAWNFFLWKNEMEINANKRDTHTFELFKMLRRVNTNSNWIWNQIRNRLPASPIKKANGGQKAKCTLTYIYLNRVSYRCHPLTNNSVILDMLRWNTLMSHCSQRVYRLAAVESKPLAELCTVKIVFECKIRRTCKMSNSNSKQRDKKNSPIELVRCCIWNFFWNGAK